jgi:hypothetical protein
VYLPFELRILRDSDFHMSQRFATKEQAERWARNEKARIEKGWID